MQIQTIRIERLQKIVQLSTIIFILLLSFSFDAEAQRRGNDRKKDNQTEDYFDESGVGSFRFWYGGGIGLNFSGNRFDFSISPMVGYKITPEFSIGPRAEFSYTNVRLRDFSNNVEKFNFFNYGIGVFSRYKILQQFFIHAEYQVESFSEPNLPRVSRNNFFAGGGYTSGGQIGYEISILWNLLDDGTSTNVPLDFRAAFTYNF